MDYKKIEMKIFQKGVADNGIVISEQAFGNALSKGLFDNIPVIKYNHKKEDYGEFMESDEIIGAVIKCIEVYENDLIGQVILFKNIGEVFEFRNYEIETNDFNKETRTVNDFIPRAVYVEAVELTR